MSQGKPENNSNPNQGKPENNSNPNQGKPENNSNPNQGKPENNSNPNQRHPVIEDLLDRFSGKHGQSKSPAVNAMFRNLANAMARDLEDSNQLAIALSGLLAIRSMVASAALNPRPIPEDLQPIGKQGEINLGGGSSTVQGKTEEQ